MKPFIDSTYTYNYRQFTGKNGIVWTLIRTVSPKVNSKVENCIDTFGGSNGAVTEKVRKEVRESYLAGNITAVEGSEIGFKPRTRK